MRIKAIAKFNVSNEFGVTLKKIALEGTPAVYTLFFFDRRAYDTEDDRSFTETFRSERAAREYLDGFAGRHGYVIS